MARLSDFYKETVVPELMKQFNYKSVMEVPRIEKITLNMGVGEAVADKKVMDLGCGTGIFAIASKLLGAASAIGVDIDKDSIDLASSYCGDVNFICSDICDLENDFDVDTIFQNPPFGSQKNAKKGADLKFISKAIELSPKVLYSFHMASTEEFLISYFEKNDLEITHIFRYNFPIPKIYEFHTRESANVEVIVIRAFL